MWFKQIQLFKFKEETVFDLQEMAAKLEQLKFRPCLPNLPMSMGWVSPTTGTSETTAEETVDDNSGEIVEEKPLFLSIQSDYAMLCLQQEEKILPADVIRHRVTERIKEIEKAEGRKISGKEKQALKEDVYHALIPQAFTKLSSVYAYIDMKNHWLILNTVVPKKVETFITFFKKTFGDKDLMSVESKDISNVITNWLRHSSCPKELTIDDGAVFYDPSKQGRMIRCQRQDLFSPAIQTLLKEGCEVLQMMFTWNDQLTFTLTNDFSLRSLKYQEALLELSNETTAETKLEQFNADFIIMAETLRALLKDLLELFSL